MEKKVHIEVRFVGWAWWWRSGNGFTLQGGYDFLMKS
jgi:hypothetical protein